MTRGEVQRGLDAYVVAWSRYANGDVFSNLFELDFDADGRCTRFVEWYVQQPRRQS